MTWQQQVIDEHYGGDAESFATAFAEAVEVGRSQTIQWSDLLVDATTLTDLKQLGRDLIESELGYLPGESVIVPFEPYLRALIQSLWHNALTEEEFDQQAGAQLKLIRNQDMQHNTCLNYDEAIYQNYHRTFAPYGYTIRERLSRFLGYVPDLAHSLIAEMWLRDVLAECEGQFPPEPTPADYRALTLIKYRELLLAQGREAADKDPLITYYLESLLPQQRNN